MKFYHHASILLCAFSCSIPYACGEDRTTKETRGYELGGLLSSITSALEGAAEELSSLENTIIQEAESAENYWKRYLASIYLRLESEKPESHSYQPTIVRSIPPLNEERTLLKARREKVLSALTALLGYEITEDQLPLLAYCGSGGGIRAQFGTLGWLRAAERLNLLDTLQYASGLSGSTWGLNPWVISQMNLTNYTAQCVLRFTKTIQEHLDELTEEDRKDLFMTLARSYFDKRSLSPVDLYGWFLGYLFLKGLPGVRHLYDFSLDSLIPQIESGAFPFIISTSVLGTTELIQNVYGHNPTCEISPLYAGCFEAGFFIPTWSVGHVFSQGASQPIIPRTLFPEATFLDDALEKLSPEAAQCLNALTNLIDYLQYHDYFGREIPLAYLMGIYGSAFCIDMHNVLLEVITDRYHPSQDKAPEWSLALAILQDALADELGKLIELLSNGKIPQKDATHSLNNDQLGAALLSNPCSQLIGHPLADQQEIALVDAGLGVIEINRCNIGIIPLLNRHADCIFICDCSADITNAPALRAAEKLAKKNALPFPHIPYDEIPLHEVTLIVDDTNLAAPILVYMPLAPNDAYSKKIGRPFNPQGPQFQSLEFCYKAQDSEDLMGLVDYLLAHNYTLFIKAIVKSIDRKKARAKLLDIYGS